MFYIIKLPVYCHHRFFYWYPGHLSYLTFTMDDFGNSIELPDSGGTIIDTYDYWQEIH